MAGRKKAPAPAKTDDTAHDVHPATGGPARSFAFRGRTVEIGPSRRDAESQLRKSGRVDGILRIDGREVPYEQTEEGVYSHELMYQRFSTPEELAEELVRQWGTSIPAPVKVPHHPSSGDPHEHLDQSTGGTHRKHKK